MGLLLALDGILNESNEIEHLRRKLKNRRLDHDANYNKFQKSKKDDPALEDAVKNTNYKYQETLKKLEDVMMSVAAQEVGLIDPMIAFAEGQQAYYRACLESAEAMVKVLKEG